MKNILFAPKVQGGQSLPQPTHSGLPSVPKNGPRCSAHLPPTLPPASLASEISFTWETVGEEGPEAPPAPLAVGGQAAGLLVSQPLLLAGVEEEPV